MAAHGLISPGDPAGYTGESGKYFRISDGDAHTSFGNDYAWNGKSYEVTSSKGKTAQFIMWRGGDAANECGAISCGRWNDGTAGADDWAQGDTITKVSGLGECCEATMPAHGLISPGDPAGYTGESGKYFRISDGDAHALFGDNYAWNGKSYEVTSSKGKTAEFIMWQGGADGNECGAISCGRWNDGTAGADDWAQGDTIARVSSDMCQATSDCSSGSECANNLCIQEA